MVTLLFQPPEPKSSSESSQSLEPLVVDLIGQRTHGCLSVKP